MHRNYPLEKVYIKFNDNMMYDIQSELVFDPPKFKRKFLHHIFNSGQQLLKKIKNKGDLSRSEVQEVRNLPSIYLICYLNGFKNAIDDLNAMKDHFKAKDQITYQNYKDSVRILRKIKYN